MEGSDHDVVLSGGHRDTDPMVVQARQDLDPIAYEGDGRGPDEDSVKGFVFVQQFLVMNLQHLLEALFLPAKVVSTRGYVDSTKLKTNRNIIISKHLLMEF